MARRLITPDHNQMKECKNKALRVKRNSKSPREIQETIKNNVKNQQMLIALSPREVKQSPKIQNDIKVAPKGIQSSVNKPSEISHVSRHLPVTPITLKQMSSLQSLERKSQTPKVIKEKSKQLTDKNKKKIIYRGKPIVLNPTATKEKAKSIEEDLALSRRKIKIMKGLEHVGKSALRKSLETDRN